LGGRRGGLKTARAAYAGGVVFVDRRPGIFIPTEVTVTSFFFSNNNRETRVAAGTGCSVRKPAFDLILSLKRPGNLLFDVLRIAQA